MPMFLHKLRQHAFPAEPLGTDARYTYFWLRVWMAVIGALLPIIVIVWGLLEQIAWSDMSSISAFYWLPSPGNANPPLRDWFVGSLCAVGLCLVVYYGYTPLENWLLNFAGLFLVIVALNPMPWPPEKYQGFTFSLHYEAAVAFFVLIAASIWCCAGETLDAVPEKDRPGWRKTYQTFSIAILVAPVVGLILGGQHHRTILVEAFGIWVFSAYWLVKTYEIVKYSDARPSSGVAQKKP